MPTTELLVKWKLKGKKRNVGVGKAHSERMKGREVSLDTRANMAKGQTGRKHSQESKDKRSALMKGKPFNNPKKNSKHSEETKRKQSEARLKYLAGLKENQANA